MPRPAGGQAPPARRLERVAEGQQPEQPDGGRRLARASQDTVRPSCLQRVRSVGQRRQCRRRAPASAGACPAAVSRPSTVAAHAAAGQRLHVGRRRRRNAARGRVDRARQRMLAAAAGGAPAPAAASRVASAAATMSASAACPRSACRSCRRPRCRRACATSSASASLIRMPCPRRDAGAGHDRGRRRQAQRAGAGDDQHRHRIAGSPLPSRRPASSQPSSVTSAITSTTGTNTALTRSTRRWIGALAPAPPPPCGRCGEHRFGADGGGAHSSSAFAVDGAAGDLVARLLRHRQALAGDQRLVEVARPSHDQAVDGDALAGPHHEQVADPHAAIGTLVTALSSPSRRTSASVGRRRFQRLRRMRRSGAWRAPSAICRAAPA